MLYGCIATIIHTHTHTHTHEKHIREGALRRACGYAKKATETSPSNLLPTLPTFYFHTTSTSVAAPR